MRYFGFDLGDAESAIAVLQGAEDGKAGSGMEAGSGKIAGKDTIRYRSFRPAVIPVEGQRSFITAYARKTDGTLLIGENACYAGDVTDRGLRFKSRFLKDPESSTDIRIFASGVLSRLIRAGYLPPVQRDDRTAGISDPGSSGAGISDNSCSGDEDPEVAFYIGCPAGWNRQDRERYRSIFEGAGFPPARIISESRAALVAACRSGYLQVGYDILSKPVLIVDIGSSTTDFAYIEGGREVQLQTAGEVLLGGGLMDEMLLEMAVSESEGKDRILEVFDKSPAWKAYCEFAARRVKERYFSDPEYWKDHACSKSVRILDKDRDLALTISLDRDKADRLLTAPNRHLKGKSFEETFRRALFSVQEEITGKQPELILLTGGVSAMPGIRSWCEEMSRGAVVIAGREPEFSVARGLACSGKIDEDMRHFRREVDDLISSTTIEMIVSKHIDELYHGVVDTMVDPVLDHAVMNVFDRWKDGQIRRLSEIDWELQGEIEHYLKGPEGQKILGGAISAWLKPVAFELEEYTMPICSRHGIPFKALNLTSYLALTDVDIHLETRNIFGVDQLTFLINAIISILVGLLCGGSGIALIASGLKGIAAGTVLSLMVLLLGQEKMEEQVMKMDAPKAVRRLVSRRQFQYRIHKAAPDVKARFYSSLEKEKNAEISGSMADQIARQIEQFLGKMAEVVEIPLG